jgi:hypothetical protein
MGRTAVGRATVYVLDVNNPIVVATRASLMEEGAYS